MTFCKTHEPAEEACQYDPRTAHRTENASKYHHQKCMKRVIESMQDKTKCVGYLAAIAHQNPGMQPCSIEDIESICEQYTSEFSVQDAERLCANINEAQTKFWRGMYTRSSH